ALVLVTQAERVAHPRSFAVVFRREVVHEEPRQSLEAVDRLPEDRFVAAMTPECGLERRLDLDESGITFGGVRAPLRGVLRVEQTGSTLDVDGAGGVDVVQKLAVVRPHRVF